MVIHWPNLLVNPCSIHRIDNLHCRLDGHSLAESARISETCMRNTFLLIKELLCSTGIPSEGIGKYFPTWQF